MKFVRHQSEKITIDNVADIVTGDQMIIPLEGFGEFSTTAQQITNEGVLFFFDECVTMFPMNNNNTNKGGYDASNLCQWMKNILLPAFPEELRKRIKNLEIPSYGQIFGHDDWYNNIVEPDEDEQWQLMKQRKNRIADFNGNWACWWLKNATNKEFPSSCFALVSNHGSSHYTGASYSYGVRPVFLLVR